MSGALPLSGLWDLGGEPVLHDGTPCLTHAWLLALSQQRPVAQVIGTLDPFDLAYVWMLPLSGAPVLSDAVMTLLVAALDQGRAVALHGPDQGAIDAVKRAVLAMVGGGRV